MKFKIIEKEEEKMEELLEILNEIDDSIDYENETALIDDQLLDSFAIITLVSELEDAFDISIEASEMMPVNFNSAKAIWAMVQRLQEDCLSMIREASLLVSVAVSQSGISSFCSVRRSKSAICFGVAGCTFLILY